MKYLKRWNQINENVNLICQKLYKSKWIENYKINPDGTVDVNGDVNLSFKKLTHLPLKFGRVSGSFDCSKNQLISLEGAPSEVYWFDCSGNQLTSLEGAPLKVSSDFYCFDNQLTTLVGAPRIVGGVFNCSSNQLTTLEGSPRKVGDFSCQDNQLKSLIGAPEIVNGGFYCGRNQLTSLIGIPEVSDIYLKSNPVEVIYNFFYPKRDLFFNKINYIYTDLWLGDGWTIQGDILEQIAEEINQKLPVNWRELLEEEGYNII
jgi:hypothetical protein